MTTTTAWQPSFDDLGQPLSGTTFVVVDLETTGGTADDTITEIGAVKVRGGEVLGEFQTLVNPHRHIPVLVTVLTGISDATVAGAPPLSAVLPSFLSFAHQAVLVAHNARFDVGFLARACAESGHEWPRPTVIDTVALARQTLQRGEVANHKLATLARYFRATTTPDHRALSDARATVDVLHALLERAGSMGVHTLEDLTGFTRRVSAERRARRVWADDLPTAPGVYWFEGAPKPRAEGPEVLYVGTAKDLRRRTRTYFTAAEQRPRMEEMIRVSTGLRHLVCQTELEAGVRELRLIAAHRPRYNRRSKQPEKKRWVKVTMEPFPRLSVVHRVLDDGARYLGPFSRRSEAEEVVAAVHETFPLRRCTDRLSRTPRGQACALAELGRCSAPCTGRVAVDEYAELVAAVDAALGSDARPVVRAHRDRLRRLVAEERFEEAARVTDRLRTIAAALRRHHRLASIVRCPELVAARRVEQGWEIHVIRYGQLAGAALARPGEDPVMVADIARAGAQTVRPPVGPHPDGLIEETGLIASWLEQPGVRFIDTDGEWSWPRHVVIEESELSGILLG